MAHTDISRILIKKTASMNTSPSAVPVDPNSSWITHNTIHHVSKHLHSISGPIQRLPWIRKAALPEAWLILRTGGKTWRLSCKFPDWSLGKFPGKRKSLMDYRRDQRKRNHPGKEMPTPGNHDAGSVSPGVPLGAQTRYPVSLHLHAVELYPSQSIYSLLQINLSWTERSVFSLNNAMFYSSSFYPTASPHLTPHPYTTCD